MNTVLVIGGAGFLGSRVASRFSRDGYEVDLVDPALPNDDIVGTHGPAGSWTQTRYPHRFRHQLVIGYYDYVFHCAANLTKYNIELRNAMSMSAYEDIELDLEVAKYLEAWPPRIRAVWLSSSAVDARDYERYAFVKSVGERFALDLAKKGVPISILRPFGGYGPGQTFDYPLPAILGRAMRHGNPLTVWGSLETIRDWIYVDDLVDAIIAAAERPWPVGPTEVGTGIATSFGQLAQYAASLAGYDPTIQANTSKPV